MRARPMFLRAALALTTLALPVIAIAQQAQTTTWAHVRAGPAREYPLVTQLPPNAPVAVQGCLSDFSWCDVITLDDQRGWVYGGNLVYLYQNAPVPIVQYGATIGLPVVTFILGSYWGSYYRGRNWYGDWPRWERWNHAHFHPGYPGRPGYPHYRPPPPPHRPDYRPPRPPGPPVMRPPRPPGPPVMRPPPPSVRPPMQPRPPAMRPPMQPRPPAMRPPPAPRQPAQRPQPRPVTRGDGERFQR